MPITVKVTIDPAKALLRGRAVSGDAIITLEDADIPKFTVEEQELLVSCKKQAQDKADFRIYADFAGATLEDLKEYLASEVAKRKANEERRLYEEAKRLQEEIALAVERLHAWLAGDTSYFPADFRGHFYGQSYDESTRKGVMAIEPDLLQRAEIERRARLAKHEKEEDERHAREKAEQDAKQAAADAKNAEKEAYIASWIAEHADEDTKQQFSEGLLCRNAAVKLIADSVLDPIGGEAVYSICEASDHPCGTEAIACLPRSVYPAWKVLKADMPEGAEYEFKKVRPCMSDLIDEDNPDEDGLGNPFFVVKVTVPHGPFTFKREIRLS